MRHIISSALTQLGDYEMRDDSDPITIKKRPGAIECLNDWQRPGYGGPWPPIGLHRYFHKLYTLYIVLERMNQPTKAVVEAAMQEHIIAQEELIGTCQ